MIRPDDDSAVYAARPSSELLAVEAEAVIHRAYFPPSRAVSTRQDSSKTSEAREPAASAPEPATSTKASVLDSLVSENRALKRY